MTYFPSGLPGDRRDQFHPVAAQAEQKLLVPHPDQADPFLGPERPHFHHLDHPAAGSRQKTEAFAAKGIKEQDDADHHQQGEDQFHPGTEQVFGARLAGQRRGGQQ
jgi:hypothetical protein